MANEKRIAYHQVYVNVMELLVADEVERQLERLPERVLKYIKRSEVETFALNRLPALYASSEKGLKYQFDRADHELKSQITSAVRQAFAAVQVDPIRLSQPLQIEKNDGNEAEAVLQALRDWLQSPDLTWKAALARLQFLQQRQGKFGQSDLDASSGALPSRRSNSMPSMPPSVSRPLPDAAEPVRDSKTWRPGTYGNRVSWKPRRSHPESDGSGFEDTHYR